MTAIVAADQNWGIGKDGAQPVYIPEDLQRFRALTRGGTVLLGRKTLAAFPGGKPLPGRRNLILSRDPAFRPEGAEVFPSPEAMLAAAPEDSFVIGGAQAYRLLLPFCALAYVTRLEAVFPADAFFPDLDGDPAWVKVREGAPRNYQGVTFRYDLYRCAAFSA